MITLITAVPGSGKTLYAVSLIQGFLNEGRPVYHNINGLQADKFDNNHLLFPAPDDWTQTPDGSVLLYDECQQEHLYPATGERGRVIDQRLTRLETHRHTGHDLFFITQAPTFVHHHVRKLVGQHIHFYRGNGMQRVAKYVWSHTCDSPNDRREQERADFSIFSFDKALYPLYKSSTVHTHKFRLPAKIVFLGIALLAVVVIVVYFASDSLILRNLFGDASADNGQPAKPGPVAAASPLPPPLTTPGPHSWLTDASTVRPLGGCIATARACRCYTQDMIPLDITDTQCRILLKSPLPVALGSPKKTT